MKVLLAGIGGVGEAIARLASMHGIPWLEQMILADYNEKRAASVAEAIGDARFVPAGLDAGDRTAVVALGSRYGVDLVMNACSPQFNMPLFDAAFELGVTYIDMAMSLSEPHPEASYEKTGVKLGDLQFAVANSRKSYPRAQPRNGATGCA